MFTHLLIMYICMVCMEYSILYYCTLHNLYYICYTVYVVTVTVGVGISHLTGKGKQIIEAAINIGLRKY